MGQHKANKWESDGITGYEISDATKEEAGTEITLHIKRSEKEYLDKGLLTRDPFVSLDQQGVGQLISIAAEKGKKVKPNIHLGVCGEHGGDPASINFFNTLGLDYVSCSPYRVPTAILAAAQAVIQEDS